MRVLEKTWAPFLSIPMLSIFIFSMLYFLAYPLLSKGMNPSQAILVIAVVGAILTPLLGSKVHRAKVSVPLAIWIVLMLCGIYFERGNYEGNQNLGMAGHFLGFQLAAAFATAGYLAFHLKEIQRDHEATRSP